MLVKADILKTVHPDLVKVIMAANFPFNVQIIQGERTAAQHAQNVRNGATRTTRSRHVKSNNRSRNACAVDMAPLLGRTIPWQRLDLFKAMNASMMDASKKVGIPIEWGGNWKSFQDLNHWQLPWKQYP
jgi:peptidoglycan L-alanyl-D-glutamate endopeptidase CwlK